jgi:hypothetical protein
MEKLFTLSTRQLREGEGMTRVSAALALVMIGLALVAGSGSATAASIFSDRLVIIENGATVDDQTILEGQVGPGNNFEDVQHFFFELPNLAFDPRFQAVQIGLLDPVTGALSDTVVMEGVTASGSFIAIAGLISDLETPLVSPNPLPITTRIAETGGLQDVTRLVFPNFAAGQEPATVLVQSDIEVVPEPATLLLIAIGGTGLLGYGRRKPSRSSE